MVKIAASAAIKAYIPTRPRLGSLHSSAVRGSVKDVVVIALAPLLVLPVRISRMLKVPQGAAALNYRDRREVIGRRRRIRGPLECPGVPRIASSGFAPEIGPEQVSQEDQNPGGLEENSEGHNEVPCVPTAARLVGVYPSRHAQQSWDMHEVEGQVEADYEKPEMQFTERLAVHLPRHLREPVVKGPEKSEENAADNHIVKMRDHEIRISQVPSEGRDTQHHASEAGRQELKEKGNAKQHRSLELNLSSPHGCQPVEDLDSSRDRDGHRRQHEK